MLMSCCCERCLQRLRYHLLLRKTLRYPLVLVVTYILFLSVLCLVVTRLFLPGYLPWQLLPAALSVVSSVGTIASALALSWFWTWAARVSGVSFHRQLHVTFRTGIPTIISLIGAVLCTVLLLVAPAAPDPAVTLQHLLRCPPQALANVEQYRTHVAAMPRFRDSDFLKYVDTVIHYLATSKRWTNQELNEFIQQLDYSLCDHLDISDCRAWFKLLEADAAAMTGQLDNARKIYSEVLATANLDSFFRHRALRDLGYWAATAGHLEEAYDYWLQGLMARPTWELYQNLGLFHQNKGQFEIAERLYAAATKSFELEKKGPSCSWKYANEQEATLHLNMANFYRSYALSSAGAPRAAELRLLSYEELNKAERVDPGYVELYWTGAHISIAFGEYSAARFWLQKATSVLEKPKEYDLERYRQYGYLLFGRAYTAWIEVRTYWHEGSKNAPQLAAAAAKNITGFKEAPTRAASELIEEVKKRGYTVDDDLDELKGMETGGFLSAMTSSF